MRVVVVVVLAVVMAGLVAAQQQLPNVILGDPNDTANDVLGEPISEAELEASLSLEVQDPEGDPISSSGYYEGDIMVENEDRLRQLLQSDGQNSAVRDPALIWPGGQIPYIISSYFPASARGVIARAMAEYHSNTCIRFVPRSNHAHYIHIYPGQGCSSQVGRVSPGQVVSLGQGCLYVGLVIHELMHAAGFWHEQSRADRDSYVNIHWNNIPANLHFAFAKKSLHVTQLLGLGYDYNSLMHYGPYAFAINRNYPTISSRTPGVTIQTIANQRGFSKLDLEGLNKLYGCSGTTTTTGGGCRDSHHFCASWSSLGFCTTNAAYMNSNCKKSCKLCSGGGSSTCKDVGQYCDDWAAKGECKSNAAYMSLECKKSCDLCEGEGGGGGSSKCEDVGQYCDDWAAKGECQSNAAYMSLECKKSCDLCEEDGGEGNMTCTDDNEFCSDWASKGECTRNKAFMELSCKKSCKSC